MQIVDVINQSFSIILPDNFKAYKVESKEQQDEILNALCFQLGINKA